MIQASLNDTKRIEGISPLFAKAFEYVKNTDFSKMEDGRHDIEGDNLYANIQTLNGKNIQDASIEIHKKYIDIQIPLLGVEQIGWNRLAICWKRLRPTTKKRTLHSISTSQLLSAAFIRDSLLSSSPKTAMLPVLVKV